MPFVQKILFYVPIMSLGVIMVFSAVAFVIIGLWLVWRFIPRHTFKAHNDLASAIFRAISVAYTVLLAFVVVISWQNFDKAQEHVVTEANGLVSLYRDSAAFAQPFESNVRSLIKEYVDVVINEEWPSLGKGEESVKAQDILRNLWTPYTSYEPKTDKEKIFFAESVRKLNDIREMRRLRIIDSKTGVHPVLWFVLMIGAVMVIGFTFLFGSDQFINHAVMASLFGAVIALILLTIVSFEFPFTGDVCVGPGIFQQAIGQF
jgi:hypothetical protein